MKKITIMAFLLAALAPVMQTWADPGGSTKYYYAKLNCVVGTGFGTVYAAADQTVEASRNYATSSGPTSTKSTETSGGTVGGFYAYAKPAEGYKFINWTSDSGGKTEVSKEREWGPFLLPCSSNDGEKNAKLTTYYANFERLPPATVTFAAPNNGSYTVNGETISSQVVKANQAVPYSVTLVATPAANFRFAGWYVLENNSKSIFSTDSTTTKKFDVDVTVGAEFVPDGVAIYAAAAGKGYDNLATALGEAQSGESITIYDDVTLDSAAVIAKGVTLTVSAGKTLTVNGSLAVAGTLSINGTLSGSGTLYKISYLIDQGDVITIKTAYGTECGHIENIVDAQKNKLPRYCRTRVSQNAPTISGTVGLPANQQSWGVLLNGKNAYAITTQNPVAVKVTFDTTKEGDYQACVNKITSISGTVTSANLTESAGYVLFSDCTLTGPLKSSKLQNSSVIDCAGHQIKATTNAHSDFYPACLNGTVYFSASQWQNAKAAFFNCSSVEVYGIKGTSPTYCFYDCGTVESPASVKFSYYTNDYFPPTSDASSTNHKTAYFYSGFYEYGFNDTNDGSSYSYVYGGSFKTKPIGVPTKPDSNGVEIEATSPEDNGTDYWVVQRKGAVQDVVSIGDTPYQSLALAIDAAQDSGSVITLIDNVRIENESVVVPPAKNITISLNGYAIIGGKIVNNGTLLLTDKETGNCNTVMSLSGGTVSSEIENNGTLGIAWGTYSGAIANKVGGTLTVHNGRFEGSIDNSGGSVVLKGGHFKKSVYSEASLATLGVGENCKIFTAVEQEVSVDCFSIFEEPNGDMVYSNGAYSITPYKDGDYNLLKDWTKDSKNSYADYSSNVNNWTRLAELLSFYQVFNGKIIDVALVADRRIAANTLRCTGVLNNSLNYPLTIEHQIDVGMTNYVLSAAVVEEGYTAIAYKYIFTHKVGAIKTIGLKATVNGDNGPANNGTVCDVLINFWHSTRAPDYHDPDNKHMLTNSLYVAAKQRFTIGAGNNVAMIRPETGTATFYSTVTKALEAVEDGGTVMLANDSSDDVVFSKAGTYTINANGFEFSGSVTAAEGYEVTPFGDGVYVVSIDPATKVDVEAVVSVVSDEWLDANEISTKNKTPEEIQAAVQEVLSETDDNGNAKWENLVIGQKADEKAAVTAANGGTDKTATIEVSFEVPKDESTGEKIETGYTVKYAFDQVTDSTGETVENVGEAKEEPTLDFTSVIAEDGPTYFKMRAVLEATDSSGVTAEVPVEKTIGVVKVASDAEVTIIPVPWQSLGDTDIKATELVHAASLSEDDELIVYGADGKSQTWIVKNGEWTAPVAEYTIGGDVSEPQQEEQQEAAELTRGQGAILKRKDTTKEIVLIGQAATNATETVETPIATATSSTEPSWNLVASPKMEAVNIAESSFKDNTSDEVIVPTAGTPKHYTYKKDASGNYNWGYTGKIDETEVTLPGTTEKIKAVKFGHKTDDTSVPAGTGFWYLNKDSSNNDKKITW